MYMYITYSHTFGRFCEVEWILYFHVVDKFLGLARIILWNLLGIIRSILLVCPSQAKVAQEKRKKKRKVYSLRVPRARHRDCSGLLRLPRPAPLTAELLPWSC